MSATIANLGQARRWNGDTGQRWLAERARHAAVRERLIPHLLRGAAIAPGDRVLDIGCGCGESTVAAARAAGANGRVVGLDLSDPLLTVARRTAAVTEPHAVAVDAAATDAVAANIEFRRGDAQTYPLLAAAFDVVISSFGVMFFDDPTAAFGNLRAALRPGGRLAFLSWQDELRNEVFAIPLRVLDRHGGLGAPTDDPFSDPGRVTALLTDAGFTRIDVESVHEPARIGSDVDDVMTYIRQTTRVRDLLGRLPDAATVNRVLAAMAEQFTAHRSRDGVWVTAAAWLVTAHAPAPSAQSRSHAPMEPS